ncbi:MAG: carotenoid oxygenase, partial [Actinophytocola sp.]|nr:carotenoid oxygenase [Actinophytocola sp.]
FHPLNAYDDGEQIVLEVPRYERVFDAVRNGPTESSPTFDRWVIDLEAGKVRTSRIDDRKHEFPRLDERLVGRRHRYGYTVADRDSGWFDTVVKHDFAQATASDRSFGDGKEVGEFVFVPRAADAAEDDGVLMGFVYDKAEDRSDLILLDAGTLDTVAAIHLPNRVPTGLHGNWVPARLRARPRPRCT